MATGMMSSGFNSNVLRYRKDENGDYVYHPSGEFSMSQQAAQDANAQNRTGQRGSYSASVGEVPGYGGSLSGYGSAPSGVRTAGGGYGGSPSSGIVTSTGAGGGNIPLSREAYEAQQAMELKAKLANDAFGRISGAMGTTGSQPGAHVSYGQGGAADQARAMAFARAKEMASDNAAASLRTLQDISARRGLRGSSIEGDMTAQAIEGGAQDIANFNTKQLGSDLDWVNHVADTTYQGDITQRGQDASARQAMLSILAGLY